MKFGQNAPLPPPGRISSKFCVPQRRRISALRKVYSKSSAGEIVGEQNLVLRRKTCISLATFHRLGWNFEQRYLDMLQKSAKSFGPVTFTLFRSQPKWCRPRESTVIVGNVRRHTNDVRLKIGLDDWKRSCRAFHSLSSAFRMKSIRWSLRERRPFSRHQRLADDYWKFKFPALCIWPKGWRGTKPMVPRDAPSRGSYIW